MRLHQKLLLLFVLLLSILSAWLRFQAFSQTPYANGWDSYFYLVQLKSMETTGQMHSPEASLIYPYLRVFYWLTGDYVTGMKWGVAVLCGIWVALLGSTAFRPSGWAPFKAPLKEGMNAFYPDSGKAVLPVWALFSPHLTYFAAQYSKNLLGLIFLLLFINSLQRSAQGKYAWLLPAFWLIINYFGHRMTFGLAVLYLLLHLIFLFWKNQENRRLAKKWAPAAAGATALFLLAGLFLPGLAHVADIGRLQGLFHGTPNFAPWAFVQTFGIERLSAAWLFEIVVVTAFFLCMFFSALWRRNVAALPLLLLGAVLIFPFPEWSSTGLGWRFWMVFVILAPVLSAKPVVSAKSSVRSAKSGESAKSSVRSAKPETSAKSLVRSAKSGESAKSLVRSAKSGESRGVGKAGVWLLNGVLLVTAFFSWKSYRPAVQDPDYAQFQKVTERTLAYFSDPLTAQPPDRLKRPGDFAAPELVIAHNALAEYFTFTTGTDAMPWLPEYAIDSTRLWRIAAGVHLPTLQYFSGKENAPLITNLGGHYYLLPEYVWQQVLARAHAEGDADFLEVAESWRNPWKMRPGWLLRKHNQE